MYTKIKKICGAAITLSVRDEDNFFIYGIESLLAYWYKARVAQGRIIREKAHINIVIENVNSGYHACFCSTVNKEDSRTLFFSFYENSRDIPAGKRCRQERGILHYKTTARELFSLLDKGIAASGYAERTCPVALSVVPLTKMESRVINYLRDEKSVGYIAEILNLSPKTISHYKRSAMRKLGVRNSNILYKRLLSGNYPLM